MAHNLQEISLFITKGAIDLNVVRFELGKYTLNVGCFPASLRSMDYKTRMRFDHFHYFEFALHHQFVSLIVKIFN